MKRLDVRVVSLDKGKGKENEGVTTDSILSSNRQIIL
jgi:hypothetical protein